MSNAYHAYRLETLSKKRRSRRHDGQQENFYTNGNEAGRISIVWPPRLLDRLFLRKVPSSSLETSSV